MIKIAVSSVWYPLSISRYFLSALQARTDLDVFAVGPYTKHWIPWKGGMFVPEKYAIPPDLPLDATYIQLRTAPVKLIEAALPWTPDVFLQLDSTWFLQPKPPAIKAVAHVAIDPHVIDYRSARLQSDYFYNMQFSYLTPNDRYLPYCASEQHHFPEHQEKQYDVAMIGLAYDNRTSLAQYLTHKGLKVFFDLGYIFDEYRQITCQSRCVVSWSSRLDLIARVFEAMAMKVPLVTNRIPALDRHFIEDEHYLGFISQEEAYSQVNWILQHPKEAMEMAERAYVEVMAKHTYRQRINTILEDIYGN